MDSVDKDETVLGGDDGKVDSVHERPDLPGSLAGTKEVVLDLVANRSEAISIDESKVGEEDGHEDGAPEDLVNGNLGGDSLGALADNLAVEPVVKVVTRGAVVDESKDGEGDEALPVKGTSSNKDLCVWEGK